MRASRSYVLILIAAVSYPSLASAQIRSETDDRELVEETNTPNGFVISPNTELIGQRGFWRPKTSTMADIEGLCPEEKFADAPVVMGASCGITLVAPDIAVTAAHCAQATPPPQLLGSPSGRPRPGMVVPLRRPTPPKDAPRDLTGWCQGVNLAFGVSSRNLKEMKNAKNTLFECQEVLSDGWAKGVAHARDYLIIKLARPVEGIKPASIGKPGSLKLNDPLYSVGAPKGIPLVKSAGTVKYVGKGREGVSSNINVYPGNSGGGVFNQKTNAFEGVMITSWDRDRGFFFSPKGCKRWAKAQAEPDFTFEEADTGERWVTGAGTLPVDYFREDLMAALAGKKSKPKETGPSPAPEEGEGGSSSSSH